jgi:hypothetical protein
MWTDFDGIERRNPIFADIFSILTPSADATTDSAIQRCLLLALTSVLLLFSVLTRPFPWDPAPFLQTKIIVARDTPPYGQLSTA